jgi:hypothetical protein
MRTLLFVLLLAGLWSGYWAVGSSTISNRVERWFLDQEQDGLVAEKTGLSVAGFPNRFDMTIEGLNLADPKTGAGWQAPFVQVFAMTWKPWHIIAAFPPEQVVILPDQSLTVASEGLKASVRARPSSDVPLAAFVVESGPLTATSSAGWTTGLTRSVASFSADEEVTGAGDNPNTYVLSLDVQGLAPDPAFLATLNAVAVPDLPAPDFPAEVEALRGTMVLTLSAPLDRNLGKVRPYLTKVELKEVGFTWGKLAAKASGAIEADGNGYAAGKVTVDITNWDRLPAVLVAAGVLKPDVAPTVANGMRALASQTPDPTVLSLTLDMADGRMSFGPFPLGPAPLMIPPSG